MSGMSIDAILASHSTKQFDSMSNQNSLGLDLSRRKSKRLSVHWKDVRELLPENPYGQDFAMTAERYGREMGHRNYFDHTVFSTTTEAPWCITIAIPGKNRLAYRNRAFCVLDNSGNPYEFQTKKEAVIAMAHMAKIAGTGIAREAERVPMLRKYLTEQKSTVVVQ